MSEVDQNVNWGKASRLKVSGYGKVHLCLGNRTRTIWAFFIPEFGMEILSVGSLNSTAALAAQNKVHLIDMRSRETIASGFREKKIYWIHAEIVEHNPSHAILHTSEDQEPHHEEGQSSQELDSKSNVIFKWHCRLAHIGVEPIVRILNEMNVKIPKGHIQEFKNKRCHICLRAKYNTKVNKASSNKMDYEICERIHTDLGGPLPQTWDRYRYYIMFLDKKTRYLVVKLLKTKDEAEKAFIEFKAVARGKIREVFSDNGSEFVNKRFEARLSEWGIEHKKTPAYTKESNGLIERVNLTLMNKVRSMIMDANLPGYLWGEALKAAVFVYNRIPHKGIDHKTPYELYHNGRKGEIKQLKRWGSLVYYNNNKQKTKLQPRTQPAVLVGYTDYPNIYEVWDPKVRKRLPTRDLTILESRFLKQGKDSTSALEMPFLHRDPLSIYIDRQTPDQTDGSPGCTTRTKLAREVQQKHSAGRPSVQGPAQPEDESQGENEPMDIDPSTGESASGGVMMKVPRDVPPPPVVSEPPDIAVDDYGKEIEDSIIVKQLLFTVEDTLLANQITSIDNNGDEPGLFLLTIATDQEPNSLREANKSLYHLEWRKAAEEELDELVKQDTFEIVDKPVNTNIIGGRWVFKQKPIGDPNAVKPSHITNEDHTIRFKARWVVQGFNQQLGIDYLETFSTTCRTETWRTLLITAINKGWLIIQYDVKNAFIHALIDYDVYMRLPEGFYNDPKFKGKVAKLKKALYGLKQAPRLWYQFLANALAKIGYSKNPYDEACFINNENGNILVAHVDDMLIIAQDHKFVQKLEDQLAKEMKIERIGPVKSFLGHDIEINYEKKTLFISQPGYTRKILQRFDVENRFKRSKLPGTPGLKLPKNTQQATPDEISDYQQQIGSLLYLSLKTRPDVTYSVNAAARFMSNPSHDHFKELEKIWGYLRNYPDLGILYDCAGDLQIRGYSDSDWAGNVDNRASTQGYIYGLTNGNLINPISWNSQLQRSIATSSTEAEYMALKEATKEGIYLYNLVNWFNEKLGWKLNLEKPIVFEDNQGALKLAKNPGFHKRMKHIDIAYHYTREEVNKGTISIHDVRSALNLADGFTKNFTIDSLGYLTERCGLMKLSDRE